ALREPVHRSLIELYMAEGRRGAALSQYQTCVDILRRELGVEPDRDTRRLYTDLVRHPADAPPTSRKIPRLPRSTRPRPAGEPPEPPPRRLRVHRHRPPPSSDGRRISHNCEKP